MKGFRLDESDVASEDRVLNHSATVADRLERYRTII